MQPFRMVSTLAVALTTYLGHPIPVQAEAKLSDVYERCMSESGGVTSAMMLCIGTELRSKDEELNETWSEILSRIDTEPMAKVRSAQRAWIAFRDTECDAAAALSGGGSLSAIVHSNCVLDMTVGRVADLRRITDPEAPTEDAASVSGDFLPEARAHLAAIEILIGEPYGITVTAVAGNIKRAALIVLGSSGCGETVSTPSWSFLVRVERPVSEGGPIEGILDIDARTGELVCAGLPFLS